MINRYVDDMYRLMKEMAWVLTPEGRVSLVVGNSCVRGVFIRNAEGFVATGRLAGLRGHTKSGTCLAMRKRYLPIPADNGGRLANGCGQKR